MNHPICDCDTLQFKVPRSLVVAFVEAEQRLASARVAAIELRDPRASYNPATLAELEAITDRTRAAFALAQSIAAATVAANALLPPAVPRRDVSLHEELLQ